MRLTFQCPACQKTNPQSSVESPGQVACMACGWKRDIDGSTLSDGKPGCCLVCGNNDLWRQKDFSPRIGVLIVATGAILSSIAYANYRQMLAMGILMAFAAADMILYAVMGDVLVCYRCRARHHDSENAESVPTFNLETSERYRQERIRHEQSRKSG